MPTARPAASGHSGEVFTCTFTPDGTHVLSGGWDGELRLWDAHTGNPVAAFPAAQKAVSACAVSPSGLLWLSGSLEGQLTIWDAGAQTRVRTFLAHTRPLSTILFGDEDNDLITASWDGTVTLWDLKSERDSRTLTGHGDIVSGCRLTPDGERLVTWSHDRTMRLWSLKPLESLATLACHADQITAAAVSPDGQFAVSGARDGVLVLWDLETRRALHTITLPAEVRGCFFLLDGVSLLTVDAHGRLALHRLPELEPVSGLATRLPVLSAALDSAGNRLALGCGDGHVYFVDVEGLEEAALLVTPTQTHRRTATTIQRLLGKCTVKQAYTCRCPVCRRAFELPRVAPGEPAPCPHCRRSLRLSRALRVAPEE